MTEPNRATASPSWAGGSAGSKVLDRNISALIERQARERKTLGLQERVAGAVTRFAGSMIFVYVHLAIFGLWIFINVGWLPIVPAWDPSLVILAMEASVEAIFLSTFVLINQNRMAAEADKRAELSLQISLLNEHETTKLITLVSAIATKFDVESEVPAEEVEEMKKNVPPEMVLEELDRRERKR
jgi:uncharacterized membrane protein